MEKRGRRGRCTFPEIRRQKRDRIISFFLPNKLISFCSFFSRPPLFLPSLCPDFNPLPLFALLSLLPSIVLTQILSSARPLIIYKIATVLMFRISFTKIEFVFKSKINLQFISPINFASIYLWEENASIPS